MQTGAGERRKQRSAPVYWLRRGQTALGAWLGKVMAEPLPLTPVCQRLVSIWALEAVYLGWNPNFGKLFNLLGLSSSSIKWDSLIAPNLKYLHKALAGVAQWIELWPAN